MYLQYHSSVGYYVANIFRHCAGYLFVQWDFSSTDFCSNLNLIRMYIAQLDWFEKLYVGIFWVRQQLKYILFLNMCIDFQAWFNEMSIFPNWSTMLNFWTFFFFFSESPVMPHRFFMFILVPVSYSLKYDSLIIILHACWNICSQFVLSLTIHIN